MSQDWRITTGPEDYFRNEQKKLAMDQRRPVIRRAADLVGPGIGASAVRITDFNDVLATFNGYFSAFGGAGGAANSPIPTGAAVPLVGYTFMDSEFGGVQTFTNLEASVEYRRSFTRAPSAPDTLTWSTWTKTFVGGPVGQQLLSHSGTGGTLTYEVISGQVFVECAINIAMANGATVTVLDVANAIPAIYRPRNSLNLQQGWVNVGNRSASIQRFANGSITANQFTGSAAAQLQFSYSYVMQ